MPAGRPPKPDAIKEIQGTARADRMNFDQPEFDLVLAQDPPEYLDPVAQDIWREIVPQLIDAKVFTTIDEGSVAILCNELAFYWKYDNMLRDKLIIVKGTKIDYNKAVYNISILKNMHLKTALKLMSEYGMTPVARQKMKMFNPLGVSPQKMNAAIPPKPKMKALDPGT